jgi:hypothetical protein
MAAKKKSSTSTTKDGKKITWGAKPAPTTAVTSRGKKATGLSKDPNKGKRFQSTAKTPVKKATSGFAGSGSPLGTSMGINPASKGQVVNAALALSLVPGKGRIASAAGRAVGKVTSKGTYAEAAKGLSTASRGGRLYSAGTVTGKQLASTAYRSKAQTAASAANLAKKAENISRVAGNTASTAVTRGIRQAGQTARIVGAGAVGVGSSVKKRTKPKNNKR